MIAKQGDAPYRPGERTGMVKIKRVRTADAVVAAFRFGKEEGTVGSLILGMYDDDGELHVVGHTSGFRAKQKRELLDMLEPYRTGERGSGEPSRWKSEEELVWEGCAPSWSWRSPSTTSPATGSATARSSCAGATTRTRASATSRSCVPDPAPHGRPARWRRRG